MCHHKPLVTNANLYALRNVYHNIKILKEMQLKDTFYVYNVIYQAWSLFLVEFMLRKTVCGRESCPVSDLKVVSSCNTLIFTNVLCLVGIWN